MYANLNNLQATCLDLKTILIKVLSAVIFCIFAIWFVVLFCLLCKLLASDGLKFFYSLSNIKVI